MQKGYQLEIEVIEGRNLVAMDDNGLSDPYVIVSVGNVKKKTKVIRETLTPSWRIGPKGEVFIFSYNDCKGASEVLLRVMDWDRFSVDDRMGQTTISLKDLGGKLTDDWFKLVPQKTVDAVTGDIHLRAQIVPKSKKKQAKNLSNLWTAVGEGNLSQVNSLLDKHSSWNEVDQAGQTILHLAANKEQFTSAEESILELLLNNTNTNVNLNDDDGNSPLHVFCKNFQNPACEKLIKKYLERGADVNAKNTQQETPLHYAVLNPSLKVLIAESLLRNGADPNIQNCEGDSPVHYSVDIRRTDLIKLFVSHDANFELVGSKGLLPLVAAKDNKGVSDCIRDSLELSRHLKKWGYGEYVPVFLEEELFLYVLGGVDDQELKPDALASIVPDEDVRIAIIKKAQTCPTLTRKDTTIRKRELIKKREAKSQQVAGIRSSLMKSIQKQTNDNTLWEIDINDIEFIKQLGKGTSGEVFKGRWAGKEVAIKVLTATNDVKEIDEFVREFSVMINVESPCIVNFYGATLIKKLCMIMEICERGSLYDVLKNPECEIAWGRAFDMLEEIVEGIRVLHEHTPPIMHRDLKTLNVLVTHDYHCRIADFGLSRFDVSGNAATLKKCRGTYPYIAPEVYHGKGFTPQSDVYSISIMIWEFVARILGGTYEKPYSEYKHIRMDVQILVQAAKLNLRPTIKEKTPELLGKLITDCWANEIEDRPLTPVMAKILKELHDDYNSNKSVWDELAAPWKPVVKKKKSAQ